MPYRGNSMAEMESFFSGLIDSNYELQKLYKEHILDNDALLPHVLMGDVTLYIMELAILSTTVKNGTGAELQRILDYFERAFHNSDTQIDNLLAVSFLQNLEQPDPSYSIIKNRLGRQLKQSLSEIEDFYASPRNDDSRPDGRTT